MIRHLGVLVVVASSALAGAVPAVAQPPAPQAVTIVSPQGTIPLDVKDGVGTARLIIRNDTRSPDTPTAFVVTDDGKRIDAAPGALVVVDPKELAAGQVGPLTLTVPLTGSALSGRLVVRLPGVTGARDAVAAIATTAVAPKTPDAVGIQPDTVHLELVHGCIVKHIVGWLRWACGSKATTRVWVSGVPDKTIADRSIRALASGDGGQSAVARLQKAEGDDADELDPALKPYVKAAVHARATGHGTYEAKLTLDPTADKPTVITAKIRQRDWVLWPILVLIAGAIAGFFAKPLYDARRQRLVLLLRLRTLRESYAAAFPNRRSGFDPLRKVFDDDVPPVPDKAACANADASAFTKLYCRVERVKSGAGADALEPEVKAMEDDVDRWLRVDRALRRLAAMFATLDDNVQASADPFMAALRAQLGGGTVVPDDEAATAKLVAALEEARAIITGYDDTRLLWVRKADAPPALKPSEIYKAHFPDDKLLGARDAADLAAFRAAVANAQVALDQLTDKAEVREAFAMAPFPAAAPPADDDAEVAAADDGTAGHLEHTLKVLDYMVFWITLLISVLAYLPTIYAGKPFGSVADYFAAFAAGFGGQALAGIAIFPLVRATIERVVPPKAA